MKACHSRPRGAVFALRPGCPGGLQPLALRPRIKPGAAGDPPRDSTGGKRMKTLVRLAVAALAVSATTVAYAQQPKSGGILRMYHRENPPSMSIHEEATYSVNVSSMPIFSNLVIYDQHKAQNSIDTIQPELATSWQWSEDGKALTFKLREGVKWHDGKPFTSADVKCTFEMLQGKSQNKFRKNPRKDWYFNLEEVTTEGDLQATFHLKRPQPAMLAMLASGYSPIYACHVSAAQQRTNPIGTGPFKFVELKQNESIKLVKNPDYFKKGLPYLDGIEYTILPNRSTAILGFIAGKFDITFPTEVSIPLLKDVKSQAPNAVCALEQTNVATNLIMNRESPPFNDENVRRALALSLDRKSFVDILFEGNSDLGGAMLPPPNGVWGMPADQLKTVIGYGEDVKKNRDEARKLMEKAGFGPNKRLALKVSTRNLAVYRDPAVILIDQLKDIYIDGELDVVESGIWFAKVARKEYQIGLNLTGAGIDDPDQTFYENFGCGSERNYTLYCNKDLQKQFDAQSVEKDVEKRKKLVWEIDKKLQEDVARPILYHARQGTCWAPYVKNITIMRNSSYNGFRYEDVWMDK
jgi:peptide/nickel transport system substrate-binding protein